MELVKVTDENIKEIKLDSVKELHIIKDQDRFQIFGTIVRGKKSTKKRKQITSDDRKPKKPKKEPKLKFVRRERVPPLLHFLNLCVQDKEESDDGFVKVTDKYFINNIQLQEMLKNYKAKKLTDEYVYPDDDAVPKVVLMNRVWNDREETIFYSTENNILCSNLMAVCGFFSAVGASDIVNKSEKKEKISIPNFVNGDMQEFTFGQKSWLYLLLIGFDGRFGVYHKNMLSYVTQMFRKDDDTEETRQWYEYVTNCYLDMKTELKVMKSTDVQRIVALTSGFVHRRAIENDLNTKFTSEKWTKDFNEHVFQFTEKFGKSKQEVKGNKDIKANKDLKISNSVVKFVVESISGAIERNNAKDKS